MSRFAIPCQGKACHGEERWGGEMGRRDGEREGREEGELESYYVRML